KRSFIGFYSVHIRTEHMVDMPCVAGSSFDAHSFFEGINSGSEMIDLLVEQTIRLQRFGHGGHSLSMAHGVFWGYARNICLNRLIEPGLEILTAAFQNRKNRIGHLGNQIAIDQGETTTNIRQRQTT